VVHAARLLRDPERSVARFGRAACGVPYRAAAFVDGQPQARFVHFELRNLQALKAGDVWAFDNGPDEERAMSSKNFHRRAEKSCRS
jgi:hypothetical protein